MKSKLVLIFLTLEFAQAAEPKKTFVEFWKAGAQCSSVEYWKPVTKLADLELPATKLKPLVWRSRLDSDPYIFAAEPTSEKGDAFANAWMLWDGRNNWIKLPIEKGTIVKDLKTIKICIYSEGHYFDMNIPDTDYHGANPRDCEIKVLYQFIDPEIKFIAKRCL